MISTKIARVKTNLATYDYNACLFLYDMKEIEEEKNLTIFIDELFKEAKVTKYAARLMVITDESKYISNHEFLKEFYEHSMENHIVIFKNKKVIGYTPLNEIIKIYNKSKNKL